MHSTQVTVSVLSLQEEHSDKKSHGANSKGHHGNSKLKNFTLLDEADSALTLFFCLRPAGSLQVTAANLKRKLLGSDSFLFSAAAFCGAGSAGPSRSRAPVALKVCHRFGPKVLCLLLIDDPSSTQGKTKVSQDTYIQHRSPFRS